jgi:LDH2 family malate/lactate/ureidoglycolate dehydrogenase
LSNTTRNFSSQTLIDVTKRVLGAMGAPDPAAAAVAKSLVLSNLVGHDSHGIIRLVEYSGWVEQGHLIPAAQPKIAFEKEATAEIDGNWGWGQTASYLATEKLVDLTKQYGTATVVLKRTNHVGRLGEYVDLMATAGLMGIAFCNTGGPIVAPFGGYKRVMGTNPFAWALPGSGEFNYVLDFSTAIVAAGKIILAGMSGEELPPGLLLDKDGNFTTNADDLANGGSLLTFGGHKGSGISVLIDLAAGILSGNMPAAISDSGYGNGTVLIGVDVSRFASIALFQSVGREFELIMHNAGTPNSVLMPGEFEHKTLTDRDKSGISLTQGVITNILEVADRYQVKIPEFI